MTELGHKEQSEHTMGPLSWVIFLTTLAVVIISLVPVIFPAIVLISKGGFVNYTGLNPFEIGAYAYPFLAANLIILGAAISYRKKWFPQPIIRATKFFFRFDVSKKIAIIAIAVLMTYLIAVTVSRLPIPVPDFDFIRLKTETLDNFNATYIMTHPGQPNVMFALLVASGKIFDNYNLIPYLSTFALLLVTYLLTAEIAQKRFAGLIAMALLVQSKIFQIYSVVPEYPNFWILFYVLSLYILYKKWPLSHLSFILSLLSKALSGLFLPISIFFVYRAQMSRTKKFWAAISYIALLVIFVVVAIVFPAQIVGSGLRFDIHDFWSGFTANYLALRLDPLFFIFLFPLTIALLFATRRGVGHADSIMFLIMATLLSSALLSGMTGQQNQPYRFIVLLVFFAIGVGTTLSKKIH